MVPLLVLFGTIAGAWYLLIVRPQKDQQTRHGQVVDRMQVGDHVLTVGGIYGRVVALEGGSVVLELAPGTNTRIATEGVARIVQGVDSPLPVQATTPTSGHDMQHSPQQPQIQPAQPQAEPAPAFAGWQAPALPPGAAPIQSQPPAPAPTPTYDAPMPQYVPPAPAPMGAPVAARPWGDVAPVHAPGAPQPVAQQPQAPQPYQYAQPVQPQPVYAQAPAPHHAPPSAGLPPAPVLTPFRVAQPQYAAPAPVQYAAPQAHLQQPQYAQPLAHPQQPQYAVPAPAPVPVQYAAAPVQYAPAPVQPVHAAAPQQAYQQPQPVAPPSPEQAQAAGRRRSSAPSGMGSNLRLDDPSLRDTISQARQERAGLAEEYRQLHAPLVDTTPAPTDIAHYGVHGGQPVPMLFAPQGGQTTYPTQHVPYEEQHVLVDPYTQQPAHGMPRPHVQAPSEHVDPALVGAFQRRAPYAPQPPAPVGQATPA